MFFPDPNPRDPTPLTWPVWVPALSAAFMIVLIASLTTVLALKYDAVRPKVGDMIVFLPAPPTSDPWQLAVNASAVAGRDPSAGPCLFNPDVMSAHGGSFIIEAREAADPPRFRMHWSGKQTAKGEGDCGAAADLVLDRYDLQRLANSAGGFGIKLRRETVDLKQVPIAFP